MKTFLTIAAAAAVTYALVKYALEHAEELQGEDQAGAGAGPSARPGEPGSDAADAPSSVDDIPTLQPTLQGVRDAEPQRPEPLRDSDLNVAQNAPF